MADSLALVELYNACGGRQWAQQDGWLGDEPLNTWFGVETANVQDFERVVGLSLPSNRLSGRLPRNFNRLTALERLDLSDNALKELSIVERLPESTNLENNKLTFSDILPFLQRFDLPPGLDVTPQKNQDTTTYYIKIGDAETIRPPVSDTLLNPDFPLQFTWSRRDTDLANNTNFITDPASPFLGMRQMTPADTGLYMLRIQAPDSPFDGLEIVVPVEVRALCEEKETGNCFVCGEFILDAGAADPGAVDEFLRKQIEDGASVDSCLCSESLYILRYDVLDPDFLEARRDQAESEVIPEGTELNIKSRNRFFRGFDIVKEGLAIDLFAGLGFNGQGKPVRIGLVDSGSDQFHSLLGDIFWRNPGELIDGTDSDGNCAPDDLFGYDFANQGGYPAPDDNIGHGTHMAGIISSNTPRDVELQVIDSKFLDAEASSTLFEAVCAIYYAVEQDAGVINLSWGYTGQPVELLKRVITLTRDSNIVVVASAGNDQNNNDDLPHWPSSFSPDFENMISVTAVKRVGDLDFAFASEFSNFGPKTVDIAAPGALITSTHLDNAMATLSGTSMAAGFVTRTVAHMRAERPDLPADLVVQCLLATGTALPSLADRTITGAMISPADALGCLITDIDPVLAEEKGPLVYPQPFRDRITLDLSAWHRGEMLFSLYTGMGQRVLSRRLKAGGTEEILLDGRDLPAGLYVYRFEYEGHQWAGRLIRQP